MSRQLTPQQISFYDDPEQCGTPKGGYLNNFAPATRPETIEDMARYIEDHPRYNTMHSWNASTSFSHNVKIHKLNFPNPEAEERAWQLFDMPDWDEIECRDLIEEFEAQQPGFTIGFNGRSSGYLVLYRKNYPGQSIQYDYDLESALEAYDDAEKDEKGTGQYADAVTELQALVNVVYDFDKACNWIVHSFVTFCESHDVEEQQIMVEKTIKVVIERENAAA